MGEQEDLLDQVGTGSSIIIAGFVISTTFGYAANIVYTRLLGPESYGVLAQSEGIIEAVTVVCAFGAGSAMAHFVSRTRGEKTRSALASYALITIPLSVGASAALYFSAPTISRVLTQSLALSEPVRVLCVTIPLSAVITILYGYFRGVKNAKYTTVVKNILFPLTEIAVAAALVQSGLRVVEVAYADLISTVVCLTAAIWLFRKIRGPSEPGINLMVGDIASFAWPLFLLSIFAQIQEWFDIIMLGWLKGSSQSGIYSAAYGAATMVPLALGTLRYMLLPTFSRLRSEGSDSRIKQIYRTSSRWILSATLPLFGAMSVFSEQILSLSFGGAYAEGSLALSVLSTGFLFQAISGPNKPVLMSSGKTKEVLIGAGTVVLVNVIMNVALIPGFGLLGAAVSLTLGLIAGRTVYLVLVNRDLDIVPFSKLHVPPIKAFVAATAPASVFELAYSPSPKIGVLSGLAYMGIYCLILVNLGGLTEDDLELLDSIGQKTGLEPGAATRFVKKFKIFD